MVPFLGETPFKCGLGFQMDFSFVQQNTQSNDSLLPQYKTLVCNTKMPFFNVTFKIKQKQAQGEF